MSTAYENVKNSLALKLINKKLNEELLKTVPHKDFLDLAIIVQVENQAKEQCAIASIPVTYDLLILWGVSFDTVFAQAWKNFHKEKTVVYKNMPDDVIAYALTRRNVINGATRILDSNTLFSLAWQLNSDLLVIPSSVDEVLLIPHFDLLDLDGIREDICDINNSDLVGEGNVLSDHPYIFRQDKGWED